MTAPFHTLKAKLLAGEELADDEREAVAAALDPDALARWERQQQRRERDAAIRRYCRSYLSHLAGPRPAAERFLEHLNDYERRDWQRDGHASTCPPHLDGWPKGQLWRALKHGPVPRTWRRIMTILADCEADQFSISQDDDVAGDGR
ncbi:MAG: hypothetical protein RIM84_20960 [Alphaproteobacteria bacterium]